MLNLSSWPIRRDRTISAAGAITIAVLAWLWLIGKGSETHSHHSLDFAATFLTWTVMMVAMMLPSTLPFIHAFGAEHQRRRSRGLTFVPAGVFLAGYFAMWTAFSAVAAAVQQALHRGALLSSMTATNSTLGGGILIAAGIYQWTSLKDACLRHCRTPLSFLLSDWREGWLGAFRMGIDHGLFCLGCCWLLMALPFAAGLMNLLWMAALTVFILVEKTAPAGQWFGKIGGVALLGIGTWMIASAAR